MINTNFRNRHLEKLKMAVFSHYFLYKYNIFNYYCYSHKHGQFPTSFCCEGARIRTLAQARWRVPDKNLKNQLI